MRLFFTPQTEPPVPNPFDSVVQDAEVAVEMAEQLANLDHRVLVELALMRLPYFPELMPPGFTYRREVCV